MDERFMRTRLLLGDEAMEALSRACVAVAGAGGVGGACAEALVRCGLGKLILVDNDSVSLTNLNRQLFATGDSVGLLKVEAARRRLLSLNPALDYEPLPVFYTDESKAELFSRKPDLVIDAIDTVSAKLSLAAECRARGIPIITCLGTGNRLDPSAFRIGTVEDTAGCGCGLARVMRRECKKRGITGLPVVYSQEPPRPVAIPETEDAPLFGRHPPASVSFCPPVAGYLLASWAVRQLASRSQPPERRI